jgi:hypothetical protein
MVIVDEFQFGSIDTTVKNSTSRYRFLSTAKSVHGVVAIAVLLEMKGTNWVHRQSMAVTIAAVARWRLVPRQRPNTRGMLAW